MDTAHQGWTMDNSSKGLFTFLWPVLKNGPFVLFRFCIRDLGFLFATTGPYPFSFRVCDCYLFVSWDIPDIVFHRVSGTEYAAGFNSSNKYAFLGRRGLLLWLAMPSSPGKVSIFLRMSPCRVLAPALCPMWILNRMDTGLYFDSLWGNLLWTKSTVS